MIGPLCCAGWNKWSLTWNSWKSRQKMNLDHQPATLQTKLGPKPFKAPLRFAANRLGRSIPINMVTSFWTRTCMQSCHSAEYSSCGEQLISYRRCSLRRTFTGFRGIILIRIQYTCKGKILHTYFITVQTVYIRSRWHICANCALIKGVAFSAVINGAYRNAPIFPKFGFAELVH